MSNEDKLLQETEKVERLKAVWFALPQRANVQVPEAKMKKWWERLEKLYKSNDRHYHTLHHIHSLEKIHHTDRVAVAALRLNDPKQSMLIDIAIYFHDAIYDPKASNNEEKSNELWLEFIKEVPIFTNKDDIALISKWILATKDHTTQPESIRQSDPGMALFLDLDLAILAAPEEEYLEYAANIRKEYSHVPEQEYVEKRVAVLKKFLEAPRLYYTDSFHRHYEPRAKENIQKEIDSLTNANTPQENNNSGEAAASS